MKEKLKRSAEIAIKDCMAVKPGENVLIITDDPKNAVAQALWEKAAEAGADAVCIKIAPRKVNDPELPLPVAAAMKAADVVLGPTLHSSFSHTKARLEATEAGARIATLPGVTEDMMQRTLSADYVHIGKSSRKFAEVLTDGKVVHLTTAAGTNLTLSVAGRKAESDTGLNHERGAFSNLPAGEAFIAPLEETAEGIVVIDGAMAGIGILPSPITLTVENGYATKIEGGPEAAKLEALLEKHGKQARNVAELGIGTNDKAMITGLVLEDEKVMGTVHLALGNNAGFGGKVDVPIHLDGILNRPTLTVDGKIVIKNGQHLL